MMIIIAPYGDHHRLPDSPVIEDLVIAVDDLAIEVDEAVSGDDNLRVVVSLDQPEHELLRDERQPLLWSVVVAEGADGPPIDGTRRVGRQNHGINVAPDEGHRDASHHASTSLLVILEGTIIVEEQRDARTHGQYVVASDDGHDGSDVVLGDHRAEVEHV